MVLMLLGGPVCSWGWREYERRQMERERAEWILKVERLQKLRDAQGRSYPYFQLDAF
jgi:hypothetical protein